MSTKTIFKQEAREKLLKGINTIADVVATTLGPKGLNVSIAKTDQSGNIYSAVVIHDGINCAKSVVPEDPFENMGATLIREASSKTNDIASDGTSTSMVLARAVVNKGMQYVSSGYNPMIIKKGLDKGLTFIISELDKLKKEIKPDDKESISQIATISADSKEIGELVADSIIKIGQDGLLTAEESKGKGIEVKETSGMEFDQGFLSSYFLLPESTEVNIQHPYVVITDKKLNSVQEILPFLQKLRPLSKEFVIIADEVDGDALTVLAVNKMQGNFDCVAVKAPGFGDRKKGILEDIAVLTGGKVISDKLDDLKTIDPEEYCGHCDSVISTKDSTKILGGKGENIEARIKTLKKEIETANDYDKDLLKERIAKLSGGAIVLQVGGVTEVEMRDKLERVKDAIGSTKAAIEEGILPGGGVALLRISKLLDQVETSNEEEQIGIKILKFALEQPILTLIKNSGEDSSILLRVLDSPADYGFDAVTGEVCSMLDRGIIDAVKVTKSAITNAVSVGEMILTTDVLITDIPDKK
jgi:chaperonin GroEL